ncbi:cell division protein FtsW [Chitinophaga terrae (ex Kim and Jung 2007)]|uniref:Probable peptidoglycan glycosyltransferase FtsW n=1 Tax=Chitinophaga terrae (ex Kim and Jung 2007) TaxID=408074 RepID=A0A1H4DLJ3_9BACT|nr:FtsW/RodA/SpoVE family cell cycle protein [Chitinophaga terrae (ex Kim and Jung 2007)]MDQ0107811.1 cell division protein FtsW [Chitinophaga terrae (ex Kim and Jung 2007)]GEP90985.1 cell division protein FtsW [Chitinophaga terrae (ex Kim and Jung 2007)]SEA73625.1 cell division protein FtsW [Chitinophaga terrae (ex Kim and Jung 2007)]
MAELLYKTKGDKVIWTIVLFLSLVSLLAVYSATGSLAYRERGGHTEYYLLKQLFVLVMGLVIIYFAHRVNYTIYSRVAQIGFLVSIPLLMYTLAFGSNINEAARWIRLPLINLTFQTSDVAKLAIFMYVSRQLSRRQHLINDFKKGFLPIIIPVGIICILIMPANMSTALLLGASCMLLCFIGRVPVRFLASMVAAGVVMVAMLFLIASVTGLEMRTKTWQKRIDNFLHGDHTETPYQVQQANIAIAGGGILGKGPGNSTQRNFLPHAYSDYIYATIIEEYGMVGAFLILAAYMLLLLRCIRIYRRCPYAFGAFLAVGLSVTLVIQALTNMAVNVQLFPVTGVTLPMVSMGGSSVLFTSMAIGIILSVSRNVEEMEGKRAERERIEKVMANAENAAVA